MDEMHKHIDQYNEGLTSPHEFLGLVITALVVAWEKGEESQEQTDLAAWLAS